MQEQIARIKRKLEQAQAQKQKLHPKRKLKPPLSETAVEAFEQRHGVRLPEAYRQFLLHVGDGGIGPHYGLLSLKDWDAAVFSFFEDEEEPHFPTGFLASPFPLYLDMPEAGDPDAPPAELQAQDFQGTMAISYQGCECYALLVVSGPARGRVLYVDMSDPAPFFVEDVHFLAWYERWLDELLSGHELQFFGYGIPGSEADLRAILQASHMPDQRRADALNSMWWRLPQIAPATRQAVLAALGDGAVEVRGSAVRVVHKFALTEADALLRQLLHDPEPKVRQLALSTLSEQSGDWADAGRLLLRDDKAEVVLTALSLLGMETLQRPEDLWPLLQAADPRVRQSAAYWFGKIDLPLDPAPLVALLSDADQKVRLAALHSLSRLRNPSVVPALLKLLGQATDPEKLGYLIQTLAAIGDRAAVPALIVLAQHEHPFVRFDAAEALGLLGDPRAIPALSELLSDTTRPGRKDQRTGVASTYRICDKARVALGNIRKATT